MTAKKKIMIVVNDEDLATPLRAAFLAGGYEVVGASDGIQGLIKAAQERPALILLGEALPRLEAPDFVKMLEMKPDLVGTLVVFLVRGADRTAWNPPGGRPWFAVDRYETGDLIRFVERMFKQQEEAAPNSTADAASPSDDLLDLALREFV
jgi:DNA-binding NtrC family response regulator